MDPRAKYEGKEWRDAVDGERRKVEKLTDSTTDGVDFGVVESESLDGHDGLKQSERDSRVSFA
jgi:hypothetical protein